MRLTSCAVIRRPESSPRQLILLRALIPCFTGARRSIALLNYTRLCKSEVCAYRLRNADRALSIRAVALSIRTVALNIRTVALNIPALHRVGLVPRWGSVCSGRLRRDTIITPYSPRGAQAIIPITRTGAPAPRPHSVGVRGPWEAQPATSCALHTPRADAACPSADLHAAVGRVQTKNSGQSVAFPEVVAEVGQCRERRGHTPSDQDNAGVFGSLARLENLCSISTNLSQLGRWYHQLQSDGCV
eukprot:1189184-Prorocentrum_minimum.AAC.1